MKKKLFGGNYKPSNPTESRFQWIQELNSGQKDLNTVEFVFKILDYVQNKAHAKESVNK